MSTTPDGPAVVFYAVVALHDDGNEKIRIIGVSTPKLRGVHTMGRASGPETGDQASTTLGRKANPARIAASGICTLLETRDVFARTKPLDR